jgi:hypothetical protein
MTFASGVRAEGKMAEPQQADDDAWPCGWEGHERAQLRRMAELPFRLKLQWLEDAQRLVLQLSKQRCAPKGPDTA